MRTIYPVVLVLGMMLMAAFFVGSGFNGIVSGESNVDALGGELDEKAGESAVGVNGSGGNLSASRSASDEGSIVGLVVSAASNLFNFVGLVALLPTTLQKLGFPAWFALPVGATVSIVASIGLIQFISGRRYV